MEGIEYTVYRSSSEVTIIFNIPSVSYAMILVSHGQTLLSLHESRAVWPCTELLHVYLLFFFVGGGGGGGGGE